MVLLALSDIELELECIINPDVDPNCVCLLSGGGPEMNTDISGPGVRISFYLQALFLAALTSRSELEDMESAIFTLVITDVATVVTSLILGFKSNPEISFHDALVVFYLLALSWVAVYFSLPAYNRYVHSSRVLQLTSIIQSIVVFAFGLAVIVTAPTFGSTPRCNKNAVAVIFRPFNALHTGRIVASIVLGLVLLLYICLTVFDYHAIIVGKIAKVRNWLTDKKFQRDEKAKAKAVVTNGNANHLECGAGGSGHSREDVDSNFEHGGNLNIAIKANKRKKRSRRYKYLDGLVSHSETGVGIHKLPVLGRLFVELTFIFVLWALFVINTELLIHWNHFDGGGVSSDSWQFGQVLPMFLVFIPLCSLVKAFHKYGLGHREHSSALTKDERYWKYRRRCPHCRVGYFQNPGRRASTGQLEEVQQSGSGSGGATGTWPRIDHFTNLHPAPFTLPPSPPGSDYSDHSLSSIPGNGEMDVTRPE